VAAGLRCTRLPRARAGRDPAPHAPAAAPRLAPPRRPLPQKGSVWWGTFDFESAPFDWGSEYERPGYQLKDLVIYEMSVRCFTAADSSGVAPERRGTYLGVVDKVGRLQGGGLGGDKVVESQSHAGGPCRCFLPQ
jgi:hypothetical protein